MAQIPINIPDQYLATVAEAFAEHYGFDKNKLDDSETKPQFAKRMLVQKIKEITKRYMVKAAVIIPTEQAESEADSIDIT